MKSIGNGIGNGQVSLAKKTTALGRFYFTVEIAAEQDITKAFADGQQAGLPVVYGEWAYEGGYHGEWAQDGGYHYYPKIEQVKEWMQRAQFRLIDETVGDEYHHFLAQKQ